MSAIVKILGLLDILIGIIFWIAMVFNITALNGIFLMLGLYLLVKGVLFGFTLNIASILDIICSFIIIYATSADIHILIVIAVSLFLIQKGIFSLFG